jgi:glycosyltransferase involved in cell wall biosynthesis
MTALPLYHGIDLSDAHLAVPFKPARRILCVRPFEPIYRNDLVIEALSGLDLVGSGYEVLFSNGGSGIENVKSVIEGVLDPANARRVGLAGGMDHDQLLELMGDGGIYISMSSSDGTSTALLEAMCCGMFPILSDIPANREWLGEGGHGCKGILVTSALEARSALRWAMDNPGDRERTIRHNLPIVRNLADLDRNVGVLLGRMREVIEAGRH